LNRFDGGRSRTLPLARPFSAISMDGGRRDGFARGWGSGREERNLLGAGIRSGGKAGLKDLASSKDFRELLDGKGADRGGI
jgi:hypothetical protein